MKGEVTMITNDYLPSSVAQELNQNFKFINEIKYTFTGTIDEKKLYEEISKRLNKLEKALTIDTNELESINSIATNLKLRVDEKEEVLLRINWLHQLNHVKEEIDSIDTKDKAKHLRRVLSLIQTCPLKKQLLAQLGELEQSFSEKETERVPLSKGQQLMEKALKEVGDAFINLGKIGREFVIKDTFEQLGDAANIETVKESTFDLEKRVKLLSKITDLNKMVTSLEQLPLKSFDKMKANRKKAIAERLIEHSKWNGLAALDREIAKFDKVINKEAKEKEDAKYFIQTEGGKAAFTLNIENDDHGIIKIIK